MTAPRYQNYLAGVALALGALAVIAGSPKGERGAQVDVADLASTIEREDDHVTAIELARWIRDRRGDLRVIDIRDSASFEAFHIPTAERVGLSELVATRFDRESTIVLYSDGGAHAAQGWVFLRALGHRRVYFLRGGLYEWLDDVMNPTIAEDATSDAKDQFEKTAELSRYFGGVPRVGTQTSSQPSLPVPARGDDREAQKSAVTRVRGRGC